jgi:CheY-like chemotaxis protein
MGDRVEIRTEGATRTILIVDDVEYTAEALEFALNGIQDVVVRAVHSAADAIRILDDGSERVGVVVTDIRMPVMDGFDLIQFIRAHRRYGAMPIIVITADTDPGTPERTSRLGANAFFSKPFSPIAVRRTLENLLYAKPDSV